MAFELTPQFAKLLADSPELIKNFAELIKKYLEVYGELPELNSVPETAGPHTHVEGAEVELTTKPLAIGDIEKLTKSAAEAEVVEKFLEQLPMLLASIVLKAV